MRPESALKQSDLESALVNLESTLRALCDDQSIISQVKEACLYVLFPGGKRVRPRLALSLCADLGGKTSELVQAAAALELVHAASLIHDDMPALDNDDLRRGRPTCHKQFGEGLALLTGDLLVPLANKAILTCKLGEDSKAKLSSYLNEAYMQVCSGQVLDIEPVRDPNHLAKIHELKTGALFACALAFGAVAADVNPGLEQACYSLGQQLGLGFQIIDDFIDQFGTYEQRGRKDSSDQRNRRLTMFSAADKAQGSILLEEARNQIEKVVSQIETGLGAGQNLANTRSIIDEIFQRVGDKTTS